MSYPNSNGSYTSSSAGRQSRPARPKLLDIAEMDHFGTIKWFDVDRRYGFIETEGGERDVFLHDSVVKLYGLRPDLLIKGVRVAFNAETKPGRGPEATAIAIA